MLTKGFLTLFSGAGTQWEFELIKQVYSSTSSQSKSELDPWFLFFLNGSFWSGLDI